jgi:hypothetical protein
LQLYSKGKQQQWDAAERIDWSQDLDPENPMLLDDRVIVIYGSDIWNRMTDKERREVRHHLQAAQISQFMHGEQGALIATSKIVQTVPNLDAKFYAATQVMDEARHVEAYSRLLHDKFELAYPITHGLKSLLESGLSDSRWDMTYLTMQILIEGLALAAFQRIRDQSKNPLAAAVNAYVMQDEARRTRCSSRSRPRYPHREVLAAGRRHDRLVVDAGVGHQDTERLERGDCASLERGHRLGLAEPLVDRDIEPARIGQGRNADPAVGLWRGGEAFEKAQPGRAERLRVGHDVRLRHRHEVGGVEEFAGHDLVLDRPAPRLAERTGEHRLLFVDEAHRELPARDLDKAVRAQRRRVEHETFERLVADRHHLMRQPPRDADDRPGAAAPRRLIAQRDIGLTLQDVDDLRLLDMVMPARLAARRDMPQDHLEAGAELAADQPAVDRARMGGRRIGRQFRDVLDQGVDRERSIGHHDPSRFEPVGSGLPVSRAIRSESTANHARHLHLRRPWPTTASER